MIELPIGGHYYESDSLPISAMECRNLYLNIPQAESPYGKTLFSTPGIRLASTAGAQPNRGAHVFNGTPYFVNGDTLYSLSRSVDSLGNVTYSTSSISGAILGEGRVIMADNGSQLCVLAPDYDNAQNAYIYNGTGSINQITDTDFDGPASSVAFFDGYFVFTKKDGRKFFISDLRDGTTYLATDFADAEADPDETVGCFVAADTLYIFGTETMEAFQNVGGGGFPFQAIQGGVQRKGLSSVFAIESVNDYMIFLGSGYNESPSVWISDGGRPQKLSTAAIDKELARYSTDTISTAYSWKYSDSGSVFVGFSFPGQECFVYDFTSKTWHTRRSDTSETLQDVYRVSEIVQGYGVSLVGDYYSGNIGILDRDVYTEYGSLIKRRFVTPHIDNSGDAFFVNELRLFCESGVGLTSGQGSDPLISLSISKDGGRTFTNKLERSAGKIGEYEVTPTWRQLGRFPFQGCFRFDMSDPVKWAFRKITVETE